MQGLDMMGVDKRVDMPGVDMRIHMMEVDMGGDMTLLSK